MSLTAEVRQLNYDISVSIIYVDNSGSNVITIVDDILSKADVKAMIDTTLKYA